ncbi:hypothetical protein BPT24_015 [Tenacibaculum phage pT24]|uniref:Uncharacterized protein n=1 Tax=Tenacibaculum phage pT24 TaxID=1880590 RepID=A0A1B4XWH2_9CAUD|nr:hypothetical protein HYP10_gp015 [Tenacibaculum phage pT24]BAV39137.1 hypothetical protein BPT24_015 [Tenacibaculum phage pT24]
MKQNISEISKIIVIYDEADQTQFEIDSNRVQAMLQGFKLHMMNLPDVNKVEINNKNNNKISDLRININDIKVIFKHENLWGHAKSLESDGLKGSSTDFKNWSLYETRYGSSKNPDILNLAFTGGLTGALDKIGKLFE